MHKGKKPKGVVLMIAVGGGAEKPRLSGNSETSTKKTMIKIPLGALSNMDEEGDAAMPENGDTVQMNNVEGVVKNIDGEEAHVELQTVEGQPIEYVDHKKEDSEEESDEDRLIQMAEEEDEKAGY